MAKGELYPDHADSVSLILMGDWCGKADTVNSEDLRCGEETVADVFKRKKTQLRSHFAKGTIVRS